MTGGRDRQIQTDTCTDRDYGVEYGYVGILVETDRQTRGEGIGVCLCFLWVGSEISTKKIS